MESIVKQNKLLKEHPDLFETNDLNENSKSLKELNQDLGLNIKTWILNKLNFQITI